MNDLAKTLSADDHPKPGTIGALVWEYASKRISDKPELVGTPLNKDNRLRLALTKSAIIHLNNNSPMAHIRAMAAAGEIRPTHPFNPPCQDICRL